MCVESSLAPASSPPHPLRIHHFTPTTINISRPGAFTNREGGGVEEEGGGQQGRASCTRNGGLCRETWSARARCCPHCSDYRDRTVCPLVLLYTEPVRLSLVECCGERYVTTWSACVLLTGCVGMRLSRCDNHSTTIHEFCICLLSLNLLMPMYLSVWRSCVPSRTPPALKTTFHPCVHLEGLGECGL